MVTQIIGITAMKGVGKSTLASLLAELIPGAEIVAFADALRGEAFEMLNGWLYTTGAEKYVTLDWLEEHKGTVWGAVLQGFGEFRRQWNGQDYWVKRLSEWAQDHDVMIIPDVRYPNEVDFVKSNGGLLVAIYGPSRWENDTRSTAHPSETSVSACQALADIAVHNEGDLSELRLWAELIVKELAHRGK